MSWTAKFSLDLTTASTRAFDQLLEDFDAWRKTQPPRDIDLSNGWKVVTPELAEAMLLRNPLGANRRPTLTTVKYYARQMAAADWQKTGQPVIFDSGGQLRDAGHRLWACYLSGASFPTYLVGDVPPNPSLFAYIDNSRTRSPSDALATAGLNGLSKQLATVVSISLHYDHNCYTASTAKKTLNKMSPIEVVNYVKTHDNLRLGARLMAGEHSSAATVIGYRDVASFIAFKILDLYDESTLEEFMTELGGEIGPDAEQVEGSPIAALRKVLKDDANKEDQMKKHQIIAHVIKAFNAWYGQEQVKKITLKVNEAFPRFVKPQPIEQAAE